MELRPVLTQRRIRVFECPTLNMASVRMFNTYETCGYFSRTRRALDDLIVEHLTMVREMGRLNKYEQICCRMLAEGFTLAEIAAVMKVSERTAGRYAQQIRWTLYGS